MCHEWMEEGAKANPQQIGTELFTQSVGRLWKHPEAPFHVQRQRRRSTSGTLHKEEIKKEASNVRTDKGNACCAKGKTGPFPERKSGKWSMACLFLPAQDFPR